jgi:hypothetical protein
MLAAACSDDRRDILQGQYASREDCRRDWGDDDVCPAQDKRSGTGGGSHGGVYAGPRYYWSHSGGTPIALMPDGSERVMANAPLARGQTSFARGNSIVSRGASVAHGSVSRGGFGSIAHFGSAGG